MVSKLRNVATDLLNKSGNQPAVPTKPNETEDEKSMRNLSSVPTPNTDDAFYAGSYSNYSIHLEMLQVKFNQLFKFFSSKII